MTDIIVGSTWRREQQQRAPCQQKDRALRTCSVVSPRRLDAIILDSSMMATGHATAVPSIVVRPPSRSGHFSRASSRPCLRGGPH